MKKYILLICSAIVVLSMTTCTDEGMEFDDYGGKGLAFTHFTRSSITISTELEAVEEHTVTITVSSTVKSDAARTYTLNVDPSSTAVAGTHYNLSSNTVTIPAGQYAGSVTLEVVIDNLLKQVLTATFTVDHDDFINYGRRLTVSMSRYDLCEFETSMLVGKFYWVNDDWEHSGALTLEADPDDPYKIYLVGVPLQLEGEDEDEDFEWNGNKITLIVDEEDYSISGPKVSIAPSLWGYSGAYFEVLGGVFDFCTGEYIVNFRVGVTAGTFGSPQIIFSK